MKKIKYVVIGLLLLALPNAASADSIGNADFESGTLTDWSYGSQQGTFTGSTITGNGTGVSVAAGTVTFNAPGNAWTFSPYGSKAGLLQPNGSQTFDQAITGLGLSSDNNTALRNLLQSQAQQTGNGQGNPTDASWITKNVSLTSGITYTMSWNYIGTDYVPYNDGSITSLISVDPSSTAEIIVNNQTGNYALLGFTNPGTGDYSTGSYGSTGWQISTYEVSVTGEYKLGFAVFNLDDQALSPVLLVDSQPGQTTKNGESFDAVPPNNSDAPTVPPATTEPPATDPPVTDPAVTDPPETTTTEATDPVETDPPATDVVEETTTTEAEETTVPERPTTTAETEETTTTIVESTTTIIDTTTTSVPVQVVDELPKTGSSNNFIIIFGFVSIIIGLSISICRDILSRRIS